MKPKLPINALPVPLIRQATSYSCGPAALLSILYYWKVFDGRETELYKELATTVDEGTSPEALTEYALSAGLVAHLRYHQTISKLRSALNKGITTIINLQAWHYPKKADFKWVDQWDDGHYVVLVGMDSNFCYFMDPSVAASYAYLPIKELLNRWHDEARFCGAIYIKGTNALKKIPGPLVRME